MNCPIGRFLLGRKRVWATFYLTPGGIALPRL